MQPRLLICLICLLCSTSALAQATRPAKVVLIAGVKSHGPEGNEIHDYPWSARLLKAMFEASNVKERVRVEYHLNGWPKNDTRLDEAQAIVIISDGRDGKLYTEAEHLVSKERVARVQRLMDLGCGLVLIHFSNFAPDEHGDRVIDWTGGYFDWEENGQRKWYSVIKTLESEVTLPNVSHPIARGVKPFRMKDEFYYNIRFAADSKSITPLLEVPALEGRADRGNVVAWARQRKGGGRGFGTTCGHFYANWENEQFRKLVLNAIVWTAKAEVPGDGVAAPFFTHDQLRSRLAEFKTAP